MILDQYDGDGKLIADHESFTYKGVNIKPARYGIDIYDSNIDVEAVIEHGMIKTSGIVISAKIYGTRTMVMIDAELFFMTRANHENPAVFDWRKHGF